MTKSERKTTLVTMRIGDEEIVLFKSPDCTDPRPLSVNHPMFDLFAPLIDEDTGKEYDDLLRQKKT